MPITPFLSDQAFDPETVETMGEAFATTCEALGLSDRADAMVVQVDRIDRRHGRFEHMVRQARWFGMGRERSRPVRSDRARN